MIRKADCRDRRGTLGSGVKLSPDANTTGSGLSDDNDSIPGTAVNSCKDRNGIPDSFFLCLAAAEETASLVPCGGKIQHSHPSIVSFLM